MGTFTLTWIHTIVLVYCKVTGQPEEIDRLIKEIRESYPDRPPEELCEEGDVAIAISEQPRLTTDSSDVRRFQFRITPPHQLDLAIQSLNGLTLLRGIEFRSHVKLICGTDGKQLE